MRGQVLGDVIDKQGSDCAAVIRPSDGSKVLLTCSVPYLEFNVFIFNSDGPGGKLYPQCYLVILVHPLLDELQDYAGFANTLVDGKVPESPTTMNFSK